jgi:hypothetical protein
MKWTAQVVVLLTRTRVLRSMPLSQLACRSELRAGDTTITRYNLVLTAWARRNHGVVKLGREELRKRPIEEFQQQFRTTDIARDVSQLPALICSFFC